MVLTQGGGQPQASPALGDLVAQYSTILASQVSGSLLYILVCMFTVRKDSCPGQRSCKRHVSETCKSTERQSAAHCHRRSSKADIDHLQHCLAAVTDERHHLSCLLGKHEHCACSMTRCCTSAWTSGMSNWCPLMARVPLVPCCVSALSCHL